MAEPKNIQKDFQRLISTDNLSHAYIFHGRIVDEQFKFAKELANFLEMKKWQGPNSILSDARIIDGMDEKLGIDVSRSFVEFLYQYPNASSHRTLIVSSAEKLTTQAQNALLKIAEEPPEKGLLILIVRDQEALLAPLRSRFQKIYFSYPVGQRADVSEEDKEAQKLVKDFLGSGPKEKSDIIKLLVKEARIVDTFTAALMEELQKEPQKNWRALKELSTRNARMAQLSTNKRLQLEAIISYLEYGSNH